MNPNNEITMEMVREQQKALWDMIEEFRGYDLPYGSPAYAQAVNVHNKVKKRIKNLNKGNNEPNQI